jgi:Fe2+ transport system protein B
MAKSAPSTQSHLSREDIELLSRLEGGQNALVAQINNMQVVNENQRQEHTKQIEAMRQDTLKQMESQRHEHNEQMKVLSTTVTEMHLWRATTVTSEKIERWDRTAETVKNFQERYKGVVWMVGILITIFSIAGAWVVTNILGPIFSAK